MINTIFLYILVIFTFMIHKIKSKMFSNLSRLTDQFTNKTNLTAENIFHYNITFDNFSLLNSIILQNNTLHYNSQAYNRKLSQNNCSQYFDCFNCTAQSNGLCKWVYEKCITDNR